MTAAADPRQSVDDFLAAKKRHTESISLALDESTGDTVAFVFEALGRVELRDLRLAEEHQPTPDQKKRARREQKDAGIADHKIVPLDHNPDTFIPALLAETCVSHDWSVDDWSQVLTSDRFSEAEYVDLIGTCYRAQSTRRRVDPEG